VARPMADSGLIVLVPLISTYRSDSAAVRDKHNAIGLPFYEVSVDTPLNVCEERDPKVLDAHARSGEITGMTGIYDPYETPITSYLRIDTSNIDATCAVGLVVGLLD